MKSSLYKKKLIAHSKHRALERLGIFLTCQDLSSIAGMIRNGKAKTTERGRNTHSRQWHTVEWQGKKMDVLYSSTTHSVVTILPTREEI
jgi:hypothetical protein